MMLRAAGELSPEDLLPPDVLKVAVERRGRDPDSGGIWS
jgi:hypothetical protein